MDWIKFLMRVSVVTVCYNSELTIENTIKSVVNQSYKDIEYIIIDGDSSDSTENIIRNISGIEYNYISEPDKGLYDAMNKGILIATGDIIGFLNSDDVFFSDTTVESIVNSFSDDDIDGVYGDVIFCKQDNLEELTRHYSSQSSSVNNLKRGMMPAHPSLYLRRKCYEELGGYSLEYKIAADFDFVVRLMSSNKYKLSYIKSNLVKMREGGVSTSGLKAKYLLNKEILLSLERHGIRSNWFCILSKYPMKLWGVIRAKFGVIPRRSVQ